MSHVPHITGKRNGYFRVFTIEGAWRKRQAEMADLQAIAA